MRHNGINLGTFSFQITFFFNEKGAINSLVVIQSEEMLLACIKFLLLTIRCTCLPASRTVTPFDTARTFCASRDARFSLFDRAEINN